MKLKVLGSGSSGNCYILENDEEALMPQTPNMSVGGLKASITFFVKPTMICSS